MGRGLVRSHSRFLLMRLPSFLSFLSFLVLLALGGYCGLHGGGISLLLMIMSGYTTPKIWEREHSFDGEE